MSARQFETHCWATKKLGLNRLTDRLQRAIASIERLRCRYGIMKVVCNWSLLEASHGLTED
jgi:hypothetical protein